MPVRVLSKWSNSRALRVPKETSRQSKECGQFNVYSYESGLHFKKARKIKKYDINEVLESVSPEVCGELDWGKPSGKEQG